MSIVCVHVSSFCFLNKFYRFLKYCKNLKCFFEQTMVGWSNECILSVVLFSWFRLLINFLFTRRCSRVQTMENQILKSHYISTDTLQSNSKAFQERCAWKACRDSITLGFWSRGFFQWVPAILTSTNVGSDYISNYVQILFNTHLQQIFQVRIFRQDHSSSETFSLSIERLR